MNFIDAWRESLALYRFLFTQPERLARFAGVPALIMVGMGFAQSLLIAAQTPPLAFWLVAVFGTMWGVGVWTVRWSRLILLGEDDIGFWDIPLGWRAWRTGAFLVGLLAAGCMIAAIPVSLLMGFLASAFGGGAVPSTHAPSPQAVAALLPPWFEPLTVTLLMLTMFWLLARLGPGIAGVALDRSFDFRTAWRATRPYLGLPPLFAFVLLNAPLQLPSLLLSFFMPTPGAIAALAANALSGLVYPVVAALSALLWARIYAVAVQPLSDG
jgi:hypothetical protein